MLSKVEGLTPTNSTKIRYLAGEGNFAALKRKILSQRVIFSMKLIVKVFIVSFSKSRAVCADDVVYVCGKNQHRLLDSIAIEKYGVSGSYYVLDQPTRLFDRKINFKSSFVSISFRYFLILIIYLLAYVVSGNKRSLARFYVEYYNGVSSFFDKYLINTKRLIFFNDQNFEAASLVLAAKRHGKLTAVIQHGVIVAYNYYFPINCDEFWGWGDAGKKHFYSRGLKGKYLVKGRKLKEDHGLSGGYVFPDFYLDSPRLIICPSFYWAELSCFLKLLKKISRYNVDIYFKPHPATKFKFFLFFLVRSSGAEWVSSKDSIQSVAMAFDFLVTKNSSSAVDFLILGKPVFSLFSSHTDTDIFNNCLFTHNDLFHVLEGNKVEFESEKNDRRLKFLESCVGSI